jgi:sugar phosphate isomerase/epimerase
MNASFTRRDFLGKALSGGLALTGVGLAGVRLASALEPFQRRGPARFGLSVAAYSFRDSFKPKDAARRITLFDFIDFCADQGCQGAELTAYYFPEPLEGDFLLRVKRHAFLRGIEISGTAVGNNFALPKGDKRDQQIAMVKRWVDHAAVLGAPHIRIFAGNAPRDLGKDEAKKLCISAIEECADYAGKRGVFLGLENHGGIVAEADGLLDIIRAVKSPWVGINLDTGNFQTDDPYADLARCAPYAVNVQVKVEIRRRGAPKNEPSDLTRIVKLLREANYQGWVALEYEAAEDPWQAVPRWLRNLRQTINAGN